MDYVAWHLGHRGLTKTPADIRQLRVNQLAAQLQVDSKAARQLLEHLGKPAKGPRSWVDPETVEEVRQLFSQDES